MLQERLSVEPISLITGLSGETIKELGEQGCSQRYWFLPSCNPVSSSLEGCFVGRGTRIRRMDTDIMVSRHKC